jgi:hypothetical protein
MPPRYPGNVGGLKAIVATIAGRVKEVALLPLPVFYSKGAEGNQRLLLTLFDLEL